MYARLLTPQVWFLDKPPRPDGKKHDVGIYSLTLHVGSVVRLCHRRGVLLDGLRLGLSEDARYTLIRGEAKLTRPVDSRHVVNVLGQPVRERDRDHRRKAR